MTQVTETRMKSAVKTYSVTLVGGRRRSVWCTEKAHSMTHWGDNYHTVGSIRTATTQVTETRMKSAVNTKACKTNRFAFGLNAWFASSLHQVCQ